MKWTKRILLLLLPGILMMLLAAWISFPWYAQSLLDRALQDKPFRVQVSGTGIPGFSGVGFRKLTASFTSPADRCSATPSTYRLSIDHGRFSWNGAEFFRAMLFPGNLQTTLGLDADSLQLKADPANFLFMDGRPRLVMRLNLTHKKGFRMEMHPSTVAYSVADATVSREKLRLEGLCYRVFLAAKNGWQQPVDTLAIAKLLRDGHPAPLGNFRALFGSKRDPLKPCTLILSDCSVDLFSWNAMAERIEYDLKDQKTSFTLSLAEIPLAELPWFRPAAGNPVTGSGKIRGSVPIEFRDSTVMVRNAVVSGETGARVIYLDKKNNPWFSLDIGPEKNKDAAIEKINASFTLNSKRQNFPGIAVSGLSAQCFGGQLRISPFSFEPEQKTTVQLTVDVRNIRLLDRLKYHGECEGTFGGTLSGSIPLAYGKNGLTPGNIRIASTASFSNMPLSALAGREKTPLASGTMHGRLPLEYRDGLLLVQNGSISGAKGTNISFFDTKKQRWLSFDLGVSPLAHTINASFTSGISGSRPPAIKSFSASTLGGTMQIAPVVFRNGTGGIPLTIRLKNIKALDSVRLHGDFRGSMKGAVSGSLPLLFRPNGFAIKNASLKSGGGGTVSVTSPAPEKAASGRLFVTSGNTADYTFLEPDLQLNRDYTGKTVIDFSLRELRRKTPEGLIELAAPKGKLSLWQNRAYPEKMTLSDFSAGFFGGTAVIEHVDYDLAGNKAETVLQLSNIPLQKLLDLQGTRKIYATGTIKGSIPVKMEKETLEIVDGAMNAESSGQIIYATTPEERAAANQGLRTTYEALSNFLYARMNSSVSMAPDGRSVITIRLQGNNPDFQAGRPVELNLTLEQNLLDLMRSISISSNVEQIISEKVLQQQK